MDQEEKQRRWNLSFEPSSKKKQNKDFVASAMTQIENFSPIQQSRF